MNKILPSLVATLACLVAVPLASAAFTETFDDLSAWTVSSTSTASYVAPNPYVSGGSLRLVTEPHPSNVALSGTQTLRTVTTTSNSSLKFSQPDDVLTFTISGLDLTQYGGTPNPAFPSLNVGWSTANTTFTNTANNAIYFSLVSAAGTPTIRLRTGASETVLWTGSNGLSYDSISITFTATEWSVNVDGTTANGAHSASWVGTSDLYAQTRLEANTIRSWVTDVSIGGLSASVSSIPEPSSVAALCGVATLGLAASGRRFRK